MNKPLSELEKQWLELDKKLQHYFKNKGNAEPFTDEELKKYKSYGEIVRKSLRDRTHPATKV